MRPRQLIGTAKIPGGEEFRLFQREADFMIVLDRNELMNAHLSGSEAALAMMPSARLRAHCLASPDRRLWHGLHRARGPGGAHVRRPCDGCGNRARDHRQGTRTNGSAD